MSVKKRQTMAKFTREQAVKERRARKQEKKRAAAEARLVENQPQTETPSDVEA